MSRSRGMDKGRGPLVEVVLRKRRALMIFERQLELGEKAGAGADEDETLVVSRWAIYAWRRARRTTTPTRKTMSGTPPGRRKLPLPPAVRRRSIIVPHLPTANDIATIPRITPNAAKGSMKAGCNDTLARAGRSRHANPYHICLGSSARWLFFRVISPSPDKMPHTPGLMPSVHAC